MNLKIILVISFCAVAQCNGYKVLFIAPFNGVSHFLYVSSFVRSLVDRGHEVTYLTSNSLGHLNLTNYTEVLVDPPLDLAKYAPQEKLIEMSTSTVFSKLNDMKNLPTLWNTYIYENPNVQKFIKSTGHHFDVIVAEDFFADSFLMFAHKHKAPVVTICPFGVTDAIDRERGLVSLPSFVSHWMLPYSDKMSFAQRCFNTIVIIYDWFVRNFGFIPAEDELAKKYFAHLAPLPPLNDIIRNISLVLVNTHRAISTPRPSMPNVIPIGGAHIKPVKPLPNHLRAFLDGAKHGAIYFSLGSVLQSAQMPKQFIQELSDTFKNLKQRVLWKFEDESLSDIPSNVMISKWMPQNDILAHPNVVLFISHGGLFGTTESLYHGVPLLLIPFFGDQFRNAQLITLAGYGKFIEHHEITKNTFTKIITELVSDQTYLSRAKQTADIFKDNLVHPMDEAMFWIEHVAKFKGAKHLKSHAVNMSWFSYALLDVVAVITLAGLVVLLMLFATFKKLFQKKKIENNTNKKQN